MDESKTFPYFTSTDVDGQIGATMEKTLLLFPEELVDRQAKEGPVKSILMF